MMKGAVRMTAQLPVWLEALVDIVAGCIEPHSLMGPLGYRYLTDEDSTEVIVYPTPIELLGGAEDGERLIAGFLLDLGTLQQAFERLDGVHWQAHGWGPTDPEGPYLSLEGLFQGHAVWLRVLAEPPADETPGLRLDGTT
jgi:hypothetical protein